MPTERAAFSLEPEALIQLPSGVIDISNCPAITAARAMTINTGTPPILSAMPAKPKGRGGSTASGLM